MASKQPYIISVTLKTKPGMENRMRDHATKLIEASKKDDGCLDYSFCQSNRDPGRFILFMKWQDKEAFESHVQSPLVKEFDGNLAGEYLVEPYEIIRWNPVV